MQTPAYKRWYKTARWQALRKQQLANERLCRFCAKRDKVEIATVCDHVERHKGDEVKFWSGPFQSLCKSCHDSEKQREERGTRRVTIGEDGWPTE